MARYELRDGSSGEVVSRHVSLSGAMDTWRLHHGRRQVRIVRTRSNGVDVTVVEGVWYGTRGRPSLDEDAEGRRPTEPPSSGRRTLRELLDQVVDTTVSDWHRLADLDPPTSGPTFIGGWRRTEVRPVAQEASPRLAVLRDDPATTLAWDVRAQPSGTAAVPHLGDRHATARAVEVRIHGSVVHRGTYLDVDRGTVYLPTPLREEPPGTFAIRSWDDQLLSLLNDVDGLSEYAAFCSRLGLVPVSGHPLDAASP